MNLVTLRPNRAYKPGVKTVQIAISKNIIKKASARNLLKRRIRAIMRRLLGKEVGRFSVVVNSGAKNADFQSINDNLEQLIKRFK